MAPRFSKSISLLLCLFLLFQQTGFAQLAPSAVEGVAGELNIAGYLSQLHNALPVDTFRPLHLRYLSYNPLENNFKLFIDKGSIPNPQTSEVENTTTQLMQYFFIGLSLPNDSFWVNLRPDSPDNIIDDWLAQTDVGKIMLETDLQLKKDTALATSPQTPEGKLYWDKLYKKAEELFGNENISIPTLTRPWIVPGEIIIRETADSAYIYKATLKVMLEQDYLKDSATYNFTDPRLKALNEYSSQLIRELIIPKLTKEVNSSKRYAPLRQVYYSLILAQWFKARFKQPSSLRTPAGGEAISSRIDSRNLTNLMSTGTWSKQAYFKQYQKSFKDGEYNLKEPIQTPFGQSVRSYFSGGMQLDIGIRIQPFGSANAGSSPVSTVVAANAPVARNSEIAMNIQGTPEPGVVRVQMVSSPELESSQSPRTPEDAVEQFLSLVPENTYTYYSHVGTSETLRIRKGKDKTIIVDFLNKENKVVSTKEIIPSNIQDVADSLRNGEEAKNRDKAFLLPQMPSNSILKQLARELPFEIALTVLKNGQVVLYIGDEKAVNGSLDDLLLTPILAATVADMHLHPLQSHPRAYNLEGEYVGISQDSEELLLGLHPSSGDLVESLPEKNFIFSRSGIVVYRLHPGLPSRYKRALVKLEGNPSNDEGQYFYAVTNKIYQFLANEILTNPSTDVKQKSEELHALFGIYIKIIPWEEIGERGVLDVLNEVDQALKKKAEQDDLEKILSNIININPPLPDQVKYEETKRELEKIESEYGGLEKRSSSEETDFSERAKLFEEMNKLHKMIEEINARFTTMSRYMRGTTANDWLIKDTQNWFEKVVRPLNNALSSGTSSSPADNQPTKPIMFADSIPGSARAEIEYMLAEPLFFPELTQGSIVRVQVQAGQPGGISIVYRLAMLDSEGRPVMPDTALKIYESDVRLRAVFVRIFEQTAKQLQEFDPGLSPQDVQIYIGKHPQTQQPLVAVRSRYIDGEQLSRLLDQPGIWLEPKYHRGQLIVQGLAAYLRMHFGLGIIPADATASQLTLERATGRMRFHDLDMKTVQLTPSEVRANLFYAWVMHEQLVNEGEFNRAFPVAVEQVYGNQAPEFLHQAGITENPSGAASSPVEESRSAASPVKSSFIRIENARKYQVNAMEYQRDRAKGYLGLKGTRVYIDTQIISVDAYESYLERARHDLADQLRREHTETSEFIRLEGAAQDFPPMSVREVCYWIELGILVYRDSLVLPMVDPERLRSELVDYQNLQQLVQKMPAKREPSERVKTVNFATALATFRRLTALDSDYGINKPPYIVTNEITDEMFFLFDQYPRIPDDLLSLHIGVSGWLNLDIMAVRRSTFGIIFDFNTRTLELFELVRDVLSNPNVTDRYKFVEEIKARLKERSEYYYAGRNDLPKLIEDQLVSSKWLSNDEHFDYIRKMFQEGRIIFLRMDIRDSDKFKTIAKWIEGNGIVADTVYVSNIPDYYRQIIDSDGAMRQAGDMKSMRKFSQSIACIVNKQTLLIEADFSMVDTLKLASEDPRLAPYYHAPANSLESATLSKQKEPAAPLKTIGPPSKNGPSLPTLEQCQLWMKQKTMLDVRWNEHYPPHEIISRRSDIRLISGAPSVPVIWLTDYDYGIFLEDIVEIKPSASSAVSKDDVKSQVSSPAGKISDEERLVGGAPNRIFLEEIRKVINPHPENRAKTVVLYVGAAADISSALFCTDGTDFIFVDKLPYFRTGVQTRPAESISVDDYVRRYIASKEKKGFMGQADLDKFYGLEPLLNQEFKLLRAQKIDVKHIWEQGEEVLLITFEWNGKERRIHFFANTYAAETVRYSEYAKRLGGVDVMFNKAGLYGRDGIDKPGKLAGYVALNLLNPGGYIVFDGYYSNFGADDILPDSLSEIYGSKVKLPQLQALELKGASFGYIVGDSSLFIFRRHLGTSQHSPVNLPIVSSPVGQPKTPGGIDFRTLPIVTQAISNLGANLSKLSLERLASVNLAQEWQAIERMVDSGIAPSAERIKEYIQASCAKDAFHDIDKIVLCISEILRKEEETCCSTDPTLRDILVVFEAGGNIQDLKNVFLGQS